MKKILRLLFLMSIFSSYVKAEDKKPWVYFDLGDTVINTSDMKHLRYMPGAREYMDELKREGFKIGIITNIPEAWGMDYEEKLLTLKKVIQEGWDELNPFDWGIYDEIILPLKNSEMKPAPTLFLKAISKAGVCPSAYIGESPKEITAASQAGMAAKLYNEKDADIYIPIGRLRAFIAQNYHRDYDVNCLTE